MQNKHPACHLFTTGGDKHEATAPPCGHRANIENYKVQICSAYVSEVNTGHNCNGTKSIHAFSNHFIYAGNQIKTKY